MIGKYVLLLILLAPCLVFQSQSFRVQTEMSLPIVRIYPQQTASLSIGDSFTVYVRVDNAVGIEAAQVRFTYDFTVLNATQVVEGPFLPSAGPTIIPQAYAERINENVGEIYYQSAITSGATASGNGTMLNVTFTVLSEGSSKLHLIPFFPSENYIGTYFIDMNFNNIIPSLGDGFYKTHAPSIHDIAVISMVPSKTVVGRSFPLDTSVFVENQGGYTEAFNVTAYANTIVKGEGHVTALPAAYSMQLILEWNTTDLSCGNYSLSAYVWPVPDETITANNNLTGGWVTVTIAGDLNGDFKVGLTDLVTLALAYGSGFGDTKWNGSADIDGNLIVGLSDLVILAQHYGQHYP
jgi:hypothetical protein